MIRKSIPTDLKVGDEVYLVNLTGALAHMNLAEGVITGAQGYRAGFAPELNMNMMAFGFLVEVVPGEPLIISARHLRKRPRKDADAGEQAIMKMFTQPPAIAPYRQPQPDEVAA